MAYRQHVTAGRWIALGRRPRAITTLAVVVAATCFAFAAIGATIGGASVHGTIVDGVSGSPVSGAKVLVLWSGLLPKAIHSTSGGCYEVLNAVTDAAGQFSVPAWHKSLADVEIDDYAIRVYARGYGWAEGEIGGRYVGRIFNHPGRVASGGNRVAVPPSSGGVRARLEFLAGLRANVRCAEGGASRRNATEFYRSMNAELTELAATPEGRAIAAEEQVEVERRRRSGIYRPMPLLVVDLAPTIAALQSAHDGELYEPVREAR